MSEDLRQMIEQAFREGYDFGQADRRWFITDADGAWVKSAASTAQPFEVEQELRVSAAMIEGLRVRCERVAKGLELALTFPSRELLDTAVRESIKELRAIPRERDPIAAAVDATLDPVRAAAIDFGHKLAQQAPPSDTWDDLTMLPAPEGEP
jgi:hypothetical protein